jgi:methionine-S-sulfoxide reductase
MMLFPMIEKKLRMSSKRSSTKASESRKRRLVKAVDVFTSDCPPLPLTPSRSKYQIAVVACGSFWNPQQRFQKMEGVKRVVVGYTGGSRLSPTSRNLQDHTQALFIEYNPKRVSYLQLLQMWSDNDYPWEPETLANRSALFFTNETQHELAHEFVLQLAQGRPNAQLFVSVEPASIFYQAEEYQQNYTVKQGKLAKEHMIRWVNNEIPSGLFPIVE